MPFSSTPVYVGAGDQVQIRYPTPDTWNTTVTVQVQIGTGLDPTGVTLGTRLPDAIPASFTFTDNSGSTSATATLPGDFTSTFQKDTFYYSNLITVSGLELRVPISFTTSGSGPKGTYPNLSQAGFSINGGPFITGSSQTVTATGNVTAGSKSITNVTNVANLVVGRYISSSAISGEILSISGTTVTLTNKATSNATGATLTQYYTVSNNDTVRLRIKTENWYTTNSNITLTISDNYWGTGNAVSDTWSITTRAQLQQITTLNSTTFTDYVDVQASEFGQYKTKNITITGIDNDAVLRATSTGNCQVSKDGTSWSSNVTGLVSGNTLYTRIAIGSTYTTKTTGSVTVFAEAGVPAYATAGYENNAAGTYGSSNWAVTQVLGTTTDSWQVWTEVDRYPNTVSLSPIFTRTDTLPLATVSSGGTGYVNGNTYTTTNTTTPGATGLTVKVTAASPNGNIVAVEVVERGTGYQVDDLLTINGGTTSAQVRVVQYRLVNVSTTNTLNNAEVGFVYYSDFTVSGLGTEYASGTYSDLESPFSGTSSATINTTSTSNATVQIACNVTQGSAQIRKNNTGAWVQQLYVQNNDVVNLRMTASTSYNTQLTSTIELLGPPNGGPLGNPTGGPSTPSFANKTDTITIKTRQARSSPYPFRVDHDYIANPSTQYIKTVPIAGLDLSTDAAIVTQSAGANAQISLDNVNYSNSIATVPSSATTLYIRATTSSSANATTSVTFRVGQTQDTLVLRTKRAAYTYQTFSAASSYLEFILPQWSDSVDVVLVGAGGGNGGDDAPNSFGGRGGNGNVLVGTLSIPESAWADPLTRTVRIFSPKKGENGITFSKGAVGGAGGFGYASGGKGGNAAPGEYSGAGGGGGGSAAITFPSGTLLVLAGGGGGGGGAGDDTVIPKTSQAGNNSTYTNPYGQILTTTSGLNLTPSAGQNNTTAGGGGGGGGGGYGSGGTTSSSLVDEFGGVIATTDLDAIGGQGGGSYYNTTYATIDGTLSALNLGAGSNGDGYVVIGYPPQDTEPDSFTIVPIEGASPATTYQSEYIQITGITGTVNISISSNGNGQRVRVCTGAGTGCGAWGNSATIKNNQYMQLEMTTGGSYFTTYTLTVEVGSSNPGTGFNAVTNYWNISTGAPPDNIPNSFEIPAKTNVPISTAVESDIVTITGINVSSAISASNGAQISICNGTTCDAFAASPRTISNGQGFKLRLTSPSTYSTSTTSSVVVGQGSAVVWTVSTGVQPDNTPTSFLFNTLSQQPLNTTVYSNSATIQSIDNTITFSVTNSGGQTGTLPTLVVNNVETGLSSTTVSLFDVVKLKYTTSGNVGESKTWNVTAGTYTTTWTVINTGTIGTNPTPFTFTPNPTTATAVSTATNSNTITIAGLGSGVSVGAYATNGAKLKKNSGTFNTYTSAVPLSVSNGDTLQVQLTSPGIAGFTAYTDVYVGFYTTSWGVVSPAPTADPILGQWYSGLNMVQTIGSTQYKYNTKFDGLPVGSIMPVFKDVTATDGWGNLNGKADSRYPGWIWCDGSYVSPNDYPVLYSVLGTTYGANVGGDFRLPDFRNKKVMGTGPVDGNASSSPALVPDFGPAKSSANKSNIIPGSHGGLWYIDQTSTQSAQSIPQVVTPGTGLTATESDFFGIGTITTQGYTDVTGDIEFTTSGQISGSVSLKKIKLFETPRHQHLLLTGEPDPGANKGIVRWGGNGGIDRAVTTNLASPASGPGIGTYSAIINMWGYALENLSLDSSDTVKSSRDSSTEWLQTDEEWGPSPPYSGGPGYIGTHVTGTRDAVTLLQPNITNGGTNYTEINSYINLAGAPFIGTAVGGDEFKYVGAVDIPIKSISIGGFNPVTKNDHSHYISLSEITSINTVFSYGNSNEFGTAISGAPSTSSVSVVFTASGLGMEVFPGRFQLQAGKQLIPVPTLAPQTKVPLITPYTWVRWMIKAY